LLDVVDFEQRLHSADLRAVLPFDNADLPNDPVLAKEQGVKGRKIRRDSDTTRE